MVTARVAYCYIMLVGVITCGAFYRWLFAYIFVAAYETSPGHIMVAFPECAVVYHILVFEEALVAVSYTNLKLPTTTPE